MEYVERESNLRYWFYDWLKKLDVMNKFLFFSAQAWLRNWQQQNTWLFYLWKNCDFLLELAMFYLIICVPIHKDDFVHRLKQLSKWSVRLFRQNLWFFIKICRREELFCYFRQLLMRDRKNSGQICVLVHFIEIFDLILVIFGSCRWIWIVVKKKSSPAGRPR